MENLYRKIRPKIFTEVIGNENNIEQLQKFINDKNRPHSYLFTGNSGNGKTTLARIYARMLGGDDLTIKELNSSALRGIDNIRDIIEKMRYKPVNGKPLVYIMDEANKITIDGQNALKKPLEDTPSHVYFILCAVGADKLIKEIRTRCSLLRIDDIENKSLFRYLIKINNQENLCVDKSVLKAIMENCDNSIRQAVVMLEQVASIAEISNQLKLVKSRITEENKEIIDLCRGLLKRNWNNVRETLKGLKNQSMESENIRYAVLGYMGSVLLNSGNAVAAEVMECFEENTFDTKMNGIILASYQACYYE